MRRDLAPYRLGPLGLVGDPLPDVAAVVGRLGAVQAQEHLLAPWALGRRTGATLAEVSEQLGRGDVVRTHALRTTWHYLHVDDLPDVVAATGDRVLGLVVPYVRRQGLGEDRLLAAADVVTAAVRDRPGCTRDDLASRLREAGQDLRGDLLAHVVMVAELRGEVAGSRLPGGPHRYHPLDLPASTLGTDEARARLARRYVEGHGPADARDLAWWSSLTLTQARRAVADADLRPVHLAGRDLWGVDEPEPVEVPPALLLGNFDELISFVRDAELREEVGPAYDGIMFAVGLLVLDGRLAGHWNRRVVGDRVEVDVVTGPTLGRSHRGAVESEAAALGRFLGLDVDLRVRSSD